MVKLKWEILSFVVRRLLNVASESMSVISCRTFLFVYNGDVIILSNEEIKIISGSVGRKNLGQSSDLVGVVSRTPLKPCTPSLSMQAEALHFPSECARVMTRLHVPVTTEHPGLDTRILD